MRLEPQRIGRVIDVPASGAEVLGVDLTLTTEDCALYTLTLLSLPLPRAAPIPGPRPNPSLRARIEFGAGNANGAFESDFPRGTVVGVPGNTFRVYVRSLDGTQGKAFVALGFVSPGGALAPPQRTTRANAVPGNDGPDVELQAWTTGVFAYRTPATTPLRITFRDDALVDMGQVDVPANAQLTSPLPIPTGCRQVQVIAVGVGADSIQVMEILQ